MTQFGEKEKLSKTRGLKKGWYFENINIVNRKQEKQHTQKTPQKTALDRRLTQY